MVNKLSRFEQDLVFACPICQLGLAFKDKSLICPNRHSFDLAKFGYVNLASQVKQSDKYDKESFQHRQLILEKGYYAHIYEAIKEFCRTEKGLRALDIACGEGYYSRFLSQDLELDLYAFDLSKDSIVLAAKADRSWAVKWFVGDLTKLPILDGSMDVILDIFSPANYQEFHRVLKDRGKVVKVVPSPNHLKELRHLAKSQLKQADYDNSDVVEHFYANHKNVSTKMLSHTYPINQEDLSSLVAMTPLFFHVDKRRIDLTKISEVTIEAVMLIGEK